MSIGGWSVSRLRVLTPVVAAVLSVAAVTVSTSSPVAAVDGWTLTSTCTPAADYDAGMRQFQINNDTGSAAEVTLEHLGVGLPVTFIAPIGDSVHLVEAVAGPNADNATVLYVDGDEKDRTSSNNRVCPVLVGNAACDPGTGDNTVTWTIFNNGDGPATITDADSQTFSVNPIPVGGTSTATDVGPDPADSLSVGLDLGAAGVSTVTDTVSVGTCIAAPASDLTLSKEAARNGTGPVAVIGEVITYTYKVENTGAVDYQVTQFLDDQLGNLSAETGWPTLVPAGGSISPTITYAVQAQDAGTTIENNVTVIVHPVGEPDDLSIAVAEISVAVAPVPSPDDDPTVASTTTVATSPASTVVVVVTLPATGSGNATDFLIWIALAALASGLVAVRIARRA